jgi:hypothetical protein
LDRFLVSEDLLLEVRLYRTWVEFPYVSDHAPIILQLENTILQKAYPFKFHSQWLEKNIIMIWCTSCGKTKIFTGRRLSTMFYLEVKGSKSYHKNMGKRFKGSGCKCSGDLEGNIKHYLQRLSEGSTLPEVESNLIKLESERNKLLKSQEDLWRIRSRAIWVQSGDQNNKFFHQFANHRRNRKYIWEVCDVSGTIHKGQKAIAEEAVNYYKSFFKSSLPDISTDQVGVASQFTKMLNEDEARDLYKPVTLMELKSILTLFKKEKSPGPDGWTVEFFLHFFDLVSEDLWRWWRKPRSCGRIAGSINSTFLALIPKNNKPQQFGDYRPISLCNLVYKVISKVIANQIKPILSRALSTKQLGFLEGRQIHDAIGTAHECIHSIKKKNIKALILKLDLQKAYDCINWDFLRMVLFKLVLDCI